ncbi:MAG: SDR family NAD(P)-dependent oxidoreductase [Oscillochloris sp.]|nr:SDR family NAD(P)-dependent oxidoreductase [Oscillochloris sp.]
MPYDLRNRVVVITGSSGGLGSGIAEAVRQKGARLALLDIDAEAVARQAASLGDPQQVRAWQADVRNYERLKTCMDEIAQHFGGIDVVIANAGIEVIEPLMTGDPAAFERVININLIGVWYTFRAAVAHVVARKGYLMAISSMAAFVHTPLQSGYSSSKAGVWAICNSIRLELKHLKVGVGSVHPTFFPTPLMDGIKANPASRRLWHGNESGLWKMITREEVVSAVIKAIETRAEQIVIPGRNAFVARSPGLFRPFIEWVGIRRKDVIEALRLATKK